MNGSHAKLRVKKSFEDEVVVRGRESYAKTPGKESGKNPGQEEEPISSSQN